MIKKHLRKLILNEDFDFRRQPHPFKPVPENGVNEDVAKTIAKQIGNRAFYMMGAKNLVKGKEKGKDYLGFRIGRNSKGINYIKVFYNASQDLYEIEFGFVNIKKGFNVKKSVKGVYVDQLHRIISANTGMTLNL